MCPFISPKELANLRNEIEKRQPANGDADAIEGGVAAAPAWTKAAQDTSTTTTAATAPIASSTPVAAPIAAVQTEVSAS